MEVRQGLYKVDLSDESMYGQVTDIRKVFLVVLKDNAGILNTGDDTRDVYLYYEGGAAIGTIRVNPKEEGFKLERIAVRKECQSKGVGRRMMLLVHDIYVPKLGEGQKLFLHSQVEVVTFYEKCGYEKVGDIFEESGLLHYRMELRTK